MKCPSCSTICSDLRDICPKCHLDLRPTKIAKGISVTSPGSSYEELLRLLKGQPKGRESTPFPQITRVETSKEVDQTFDLEPLPALFLAREDDSEEYPPSLSVPLLSLSEVSVSPTSTPPGTPPPTEVPSLPEEISPKVLEEAPPQKEETTLDPIEELFTSLQGELKANNQAFSVSSIDFRDTENKELVSLYFDLSKESLLNQNDETPLEVNSLIRSDERTLVSETLSAKVAAIEEETSVRAFKKREESTPAVDFQALDALTPESKELFLIRAGALRQLLGFIIDLSLSGVICLISVLLGHALVVPQFLQALSTLSPPLFIDVVYVLVMFCTLLPLTFIAYRLTIATIFSTTPGALLAGVKIVRKDGREASSLQIILRNLFLPISLLTFGFVPVLFRRNSLADYLANTRVVRAF
jgi:uncharacterized RDD family membrane protein YckC